MKSFERYFTLDEAAEILPTIKDGLETARREIGEIRDDIVLFKRIIDTRAREGLKTTDEEVGTLQAKVMVYEAAMAHWVEHFYAKGIILRDVDNGLIDFPYYSKKKNEEYFLCWRTGEDGIFYFHPVTDGFQGRQPITLLPD